MIFLVQQRRWIKNPNVDTSASRGGAAHQEPWRAERTTDGFYRIPFILDPELCEYCGPLALLLQSEPLK